MSGGKATVSASAGPVFQWLGTAGLKITHAGSTVLIDPYLTRNALARPFQPLRPRDFAGADAIFISHGHFDHLADVPAIVEASGASVYCSEVAARTLMAKGVPPSRLNPLAGGDSLDLECCAVRVATCSHIRFDARLVLTTLPRLLGRPRGLLRQTRGMPSGPVLIWNMTIGGVTLVHLGSLGLTPSAAREAGVSGPDILFPPLQGHTDICRLAADLTAAVRPRAVVPLHQDDFFPPVSQAVDVRPFKLLVAARVPDCAFYEPTINLEFGPGDVFGPGA
jgi:L-ascorbate metabolism protein UlaG (beta-lactamase superfamily)